MKLVKAGLVLVLSLLLSACGVKDAPQPKFSTVDITGIMSRDLKLIH